ncbi:hypothetical protein [Paenibacillus cellulositrophicus]|uniref:hypothetical protein n=1 Tax=Paenibacillus cellulositrophicus TaxID=562959 RepID=UPI00126753B1|nr:hypothetical protein [Paenibacillus cellulositrophicus]
MSGIPYTPNEKLAIIKEIEYGENGHFTATKPNEKWVADVTESKYSYGQKAYLSALNLKCPLQNMEKIGLDEISHLPMGAGYLSSDFYRRIREVEEQESQKVQEAETEVKEP